MAAMGPEAEWLLSVYITGKQTFDVRIGKHLTIF
jgi:hypothetical protein